MDETLPSEPDNSGDEMGDQGQPDLDPVLRGPEFEDLQQQLMDAAARRMEANQAGEDFQAADELGKIDEELKGIMRENQDPPADPKNP